MKPVRNAGQWLLGIALVAFVLVVYRVTDTLRDAAISREVLEASPQEQVRWRKARASTAPPPDAEIEESLLSRLGYLAGYRPASERRGVSRYDAGAASDGLNLYLSGHASAAELIDMEGNVLHRWQLAYRDAFRDAPEEIVAQDRARFWRRAHLDEGGGLLVVFEYLGLVKLDRDSRLVWAVARPFHHDVTVSGDLIYAISEKVHVIPRIHPSRPVQEDFITVLDADGNVLREISLLEALERSDHADLLERMPEHGDIFHTNTLAILDGSQTARSPVFARGHALVSMRHLDAIAIVDLEREQVVWARTGDWRWQHEPVLLSSGNLLLFDNLGPQEGSRVLEIDPLSGEVVWSYAGSAEDPLFSEGMGSSQRLPNGNTLITESFNGRAIEVTPEGRIVWQFDNPARAGKGDELVAVLPELIRIDRSFAEDWLAQGEARANR